MKRFEPGYAMAIAITALMNSPVSFAQEADTQESESSEPLALARVTVTSTKRAQDLQDVPASISSFSTAELELRQISSLEDVASVSPNITFTTGAGVVPNLSIRGISADGVSPTMENTVAVHVDGVYQPRANSLDLILSDLEQVEILRGPQGTLYGRNANAGVINLITRKPSNTLEAQSKVTFGSYGRAGVKGYVSGPLSDKVSARFAGLYDRMDGFARNLVTHNAVDGYETWGVRAAIGVEITPDIMLDLAGSHGHTITSKTFYMLNDPLDQPGTNYNLIAAGPEDASYTTEPWRVYNNYDPKTTAISDSLSATLTWDLSNDLSLKSITAWQKYSFDSIQDQDAMPALFSEAKPFAESETLSQELNFNGTAFERLDFVAGVYYLRDDLYGGNLNWLPGGVPYGSPATPGLVLDQALDQKSTSAAAYLDATISLTDRIRILSGIRFTRDERETIQSIRTFRFGSFTTQGEEIGGCGAINVVPDLSYNSTTGKLGAQFDVTSDVITYASWQTGFKAGGYNPIVCNNEYKPEDVEAIEVGLKGRFWNNTLQLNIALFDYDYTNMQLSRTFNSSPTTIVSLIDNAATASITGGEVEMVAQLTSTLKANLSIGLLDTKYGELVARNGAMPGNPEFNLEGNRLPRSSNESYGLGVEYVTSTWIDGDLTLRADYRYVGDMFFTPFNEDFAYQGGYSLMDASIMYEPLGSPWSLRVFGKNLFDQAYITGAFTSGLLFNSRGSWGARQTFGVELTLDY